MKKLRVGARIVLSVYATLFAVSLFAALQEHAMDTRQSIVCVVVSVIGSSVCMILSALLVRVLDSIEMRAGGPQ